MREKLFAFVLTFSFVVPSVTFAQEKSGLAYAIQRAATRVASPPSPQPKRPGGSYFGPGLVIMGAGATLAALAATAAKKDTCAVARSGST